MHGAGPHGIGRCRDGAGCGGPPVAHSPGLARGRGHVDARANVTPEHAGLADHLVGADTAQLRWTVCGDHDQRHTGLIGLDNGRVEIDRSSSRCRDDDGWNTGDLGDADGKEACGALIETHVQSDLTALLGLRKRHGEGGRSGARRDDRIGETAANELIDHHPCLRGGRIHSDSLSRAAHASVTRCRQ